MPLNRESLIIGGQPKAGTSSLFHWLSHHPDIAPSRVKEVRFFLDKNYPIPSGVRYNGSNGNQYLSFFNEEPISKMLLDSSPDYLYSNNAINIPEVLPKALIVFVVRDPVERALSWYKYSAQIGLLGKGMSFHDFVAYQLENEVTNDTPIHLRGLEQNRVGKYLPAFQEKFGDRCLVLDFSDMKRDPKGFVQHVCEFAGLAPNFFDEFNFEPQNVSTGEQAAKSSRLYYRGRAAFNYWVKPSPKTRKLIRPIALPVKKLLSRSRKLEDISVSPELDRLIRLHAKT